MSTERTWAVLDLRADDGSGHVHVVPWLGGEADGDVSPGHEPSLLCPCLVRVLRSGPLDDPVVSHTQPDWPGTSDAAIVRAGLMT